MLLFEVWKSRVDAEWQLPNILPIVRTALVEGIRVVVVLPVIIENRFDVHNMVLTAALF